MFSLSTRSRYALRILIFLAMQDDVREPITKQAVADHEAIPADYVAQLLVRLKASGFVQSLRGKSGGFVLAVDPKKTRVLDVLLAMEGPISLAACQDKPCERRTICPTQEVWQAAAKALEASFAAYTLEALAEKARQAEHSLSFDI